MDMGPRRNKEAYFKRTDSKMKKGLATDNYYSLN